VASTYSGEDIIYSIHKILEPHYSIPETIVLRNGNLALLHSLEGVLEIYDTSAQKVLEKEFYSLPPYNEQTIKYDINNLGMVFIVSEQGDNNINFIENSGKEKTSFKAYNGLLAGVASSENGEVLAYSIMKWEKSELLYKTIFLNLEKESMSEYPLKFEKGCFSNSLDKFLGFTNKSSFYIDLIEEQILWQNDLEDDNIYLDAMIEMDRALFVQAFKPNLVNNKWTYEQTKIIRKDLSGNELIIREITQPTNYVKLIRSGKNISVEIDKNILLLKLD